MTELPDDELDKLFRKSSEELDPQFDPSDWISLKKRLDQQDGKTPAAWFRKWWPFVLLAVLIPAGIAIYSLNRKPEVNELVREREFERKGEKEEREKGGSGMEKGSRDVGKDERVSGIDTKEESRTEERDEVVSEPLISKSGNSEITVKDQLKILPRRRSKTGGVYLEPDRSGGKGGDGAFFKNGGKATKTETRALQAGNKSRPTINAVTENTVAEKNDPVPDKSYKTDLTETQRTAELADKEARMAFSVKELGKKGLSWKKPDEIAVVIPEKTDFVQPPPASGQNQDLAKWAVRFGYSPDLSSVGLKNFSKPGSAVSLMVEYAVLNRVFVQTGVVRSVKEYNAKSGEYIWPYKYPPKVYPDNVDGTCNIFEVPLNFRYDLALNEKSRWFAGAGSSSYYMQKEKYIYNYPPHTYGVSPGWKGKTGWYLFSHINASAGYEHRLSKKLSLLVEPYVRIPVKRVGYGKVNLFTTGIWISVRYTPVFK
ncbi:PorT family protein [Dyadobacter flavalbus]|uniref:PorT family protein n=1 Tax=Dyadobacter flavalbus TaxID=2579942 RepID=A0A5M8QY46_9BACT|nr:PorT family protein [Dyadobacter flavalbus]KAA6440298.1 PorT family protein [Dyadobacter flavalbus]